MDHYHNRRPSNSISKVAIPRLRRPSKDVSGGGNGGGGIGGEDGSSSSGGGGGAGNGEGKQRVSHACEPCRQRKTKCSGERPICKHCQDFKISCYYGDGKRDRAKNEMTSLRSKVETYESLLESLRSQVDSAGQMAITKALQGSRPMGNSSPVRADRRDGESLVSADVGSTGSIDHIREDVNTDNTPYPTGYMGKSSEVAWIQRVAQQLAREAHRNSPPLPGEGILSTTSSSSYSSTKMQSDTLVDDEYEFQTPAYHLDDLSVSISGGQIDPYLLPDKQIADGLVNAFFQTVHPSFPIVYKKLFMTQYEMFFETFFPPGNSKRWLAMLNLIFAIGAIYGKIINAPWKGSDTEHLKYFGRARALSLDEGSIFEVADLQQVQVIGLAGMYLLASNQTNRSWNVIGLAIRYAQTLGLNLRNDVPDLPEVEKEMRIRMWFALYAVEHLLCLMTGRPSAIQDRDCSLALPRPIDEEVPEFETLLQNHKTPIPSPHPSPPPSTASYFLEHVKLTRVTYSILSSLYSPDTINRTWSDIQGIISHLELSLSQWRSNLPPALSLDLPLQHSRHRLALAFQYHNARILINRPCLCRLDYRIPHESSRSRTFNRSAATTCISAARETVALLPGTPDPLTLLSICPWWRILHYLVSAAAILMIEISMRAEHNPQVADALLADTKKTIRWLRAMSKDNIAAERSWAVLTKLLIVSAPKIGGDTSDVERDLDVDIRAPRDPSVGGYLFRGLFDDLSLPMFFDTAMSESVPTVTPTGTGTGPGGRQQKRSSLGATALGSRFPAWSDGHEVAGFTPAELEVAVKDAAKGDDGSGESGSGSSAGRKREWDVTGEGR